MTVDDAIDLLHRAEHIESDGYAKLCEAINGNAPDFRYWSFEWRLKAIATDDEMRDMGDAFFAAGMAGDAIQFIRDLYERTIFINANGVRSDIAQAWSDQTRSKRASKKRRIGIEIPSGCAVPPPEQEADRTHRHTSRTLAEWDREGIPMFKVRVGGTPQVSRSDEREWNDELVAHMRHTVRTSVVPDEAGHEKVLEGVPQVRRIGPGKYEPVYPRRETLRAFERSIDLDIVGPMESVCRECCRFISDCRVLHKPNTDFPEVVDLASAPSAASGEASVARKIDEGSAVIASAYA